MQREDFILLEIARLGQFLLVLLGRVKKRRDDEMSDEFLTAQIDFAEDFNGISFQEIVDMPFVKFAGNLKNTVGFNEENMELLADTLFTTGEKLLDSNKPKAYLFLARAREVFTYLDAQSKTLSMNRMIKLQNLDRLLKVEG